MQPALPFAAAWQGHVQDITGQLSGLFGGKDGIPPILQCLLHGLLDYIDGAASRRTLLGRQLAQTLEQVGQRTAFAQKARLGLFQIG
jgi:hypothetical protein